jgi:hypothetical protein
MRRLILMVALGVAVAGLAAGGAGSATSKSTFLVFTEPTTSMAASGATIEVELAGAFNAGKKTASGSGEYSSTAIGSGTFTLTRLVAFQFYGCGFVDDIDLQDPTLCGGRVLLTAHFTPASGSPFDGTIEINCQIHGPSNQPPPGTSEGAKVNTSGINFNKHVAGDNVFVKT